MIIEAKADLEHGKFLKMIQSSLPFGPKTAQRLMRIAADERLSNGEHVHHLPPSWGTLYEITKLDDHSFKEKIEDGTIRPDMVIWIVEILLIMLRRKSGRQKSASLLTKSPRSRITSLGLILADPEWKFEFWSEKGQTNSSTENHYPTSALDVIKARDVPSICAADCILFFWATVPMLPQAFEVMGAWGFSYDSHFVWVKDRAGTGYWNRNKHELLLIGTQGKIPAPAPGMQWDSVIEAPVGKHSEKPPVVYELIESYFPNLPKIELNARGATRPGSQAWGLEAAPAEAAE